MSETYSSRPSEVLGIGDPYVAFCLDEATFMWGRHVEGSMDEAASKTKNDNQRHAARLRVLNNLLTPKEKEPGTQPAPGKFRDPASMFNKKGGASSG